MYYWNFCFTLYSMNHTCSFKFMTTSMIKGMDSVTPHRNARSSFKLVKILIISLIFYICIHTYIFVSTNIHMCVHRYAYVHTDKIFQITLKIIVYFDEA